MAHRTIEWRSRLGDRCRASVFSPDEHEPDHVRVLIGERVNLRLPIEQARALAQALTEAAAELPFVAPTPRPVIPIHCAPPATLYHEPEEESCPNLPAA